MSTENEFDPAAFLRNNARTRDTTALIILNQPINCIDVLRKLWSHSSYNVAADGGANRLLRIDGRGKFKPDLIHGDLDSLHDDVKAHYESLGVTITKDPDQYSTDFGKSIKKIRELFTQQRHEKIRDIIVIGSISGRVDQGIGLLHEFYREHKANADCRFWLFSEQSITFILPRGSSRITTDLDEGLLKRNVGVLPVFGASRITIKGFEWDVEGWETAIGGQVSTSNHVAAKVVRVSTSEPILFTIELNLPDEQP